MSAINIGINGFGRIGRLVTRVILEKFDHVNIVAVNDLTSPENLAYLFKYDSTYGQWPFPVSVDGSDLVIGTARGDVKIKVLSQKDPASLGWEELGVENVLECTGRFLTRELAGLHLSAGAKKVVLSAPAKDEDIATVVRGVSSSVVSDNLVSNASCTTNCIAPALKVLQDSFGIEQAMAITVHAYTATQMLQDGPSQKEFRDGRAAAVNMIPSKTGAAKAVVRVLPELKGRLALSAIRVPVITGSMIYLTATLNEEKSVQEINQALENASQSSLLGILDYSTDPLVSSDIVGNSHSTVVDSDLTEVLGKTVKLVLWYDNEWGYANRLAEVCAGV